MTDTVKPTDSVENYRKLVSALEANLRYLRAIEYDEGALSAYKDLLQFLRSKSAEKMAAMIGHGNPAGVRSKVPAQRFTAERIRAMSAAEIKELAQDSEVSRRELEQVASIRFGVTRGGLSNLRSRDALVEKLLTLVGHEATHESIGRVVDASAVKAEPRHEGLEKQAP